MPNTHLPVRLRFSLGSFALFAIASVISIPLIKPDGVLNDTVLLLGVGLAVTMATGFVLLVASQSSEPAMRKLDTRRNNQVVLCVIAVIGAIRGWFIHFGLDLLGLEEPLTLATRVFTSTCTTLLWLSLSIYLFSLHENFKKEFDQFVRSSFITLAKINPLSLRKIPPAISPEIQEIELKIQQTLNSTFQSIVSKEILIAAAQQLRDCIEISIRPLSHRLWFQAGKSYPKVSLRALAKEGIKNQSFSIFHVNFFLTLITIPNLVTSIGLPRALLAAFILNFVVLGYFSLQKRFTRQHSSQLAALRILNLVLPGLIIGLIFFFINKYLFLDDLGVYNFIYIMICPSVFIAASTIQLMRQDQARFIKELHAAFKGRIPSQEGVDGYQSGKDVAGFLHNSVQSELLALSYQLEELANDPESEQTKAALEKLASSLSSQITKNFENFNEKPHERLLALEAAWKGIVDIEFTTDPASLSSVFCAHDAVQVIEEAITNAVRAAGATRIVISWELANQGQLQLSISDNGAPNAQGISGLGSQWLDDIAFGRWSRGLVDGQTTLIVRFSE
jgi:signal transduction histidine kinase